MSDSADAPRDLLFGLLALQTGLIDREALTAAFAARGAETTRPLADVLVERGALDPGARTALEGLIDAHVAAHGGTERSLAAMSVGASTLESLARLDDPELTASLPRVGGLAAEATADFGPGAATPGFAVGTATSDGRRFRVLRPHARGGLGAVFVALDEELHREVALKQIQDRYADDPESRARFLQEAEITGALEHPGIVPVYGLGRHPDGRPFYAMRFIRGDSLKDAIAAFHTAPSAGRDAGARSLELRQLLRRFTDVCNAVEYAHRRGVLHRDLKPGNVMIGRYGETLVVDWGLAKALGSAEGGPGPGERPVAPASSGGTPATLPGSAMGTPGYMSPEQAAGEVERLGPRSDVYSLGATLYCLLTGRAPFTRDEGEDIVPLLEAVRRGDFRPPRHWEPSIDPALEAICLRAMALEPGDRHGSPRALADDVERWTADEPVSAYPEPRSRRLARWARRHAPVVSGVGALLTTAVIALALSTWLIAREKARVEAARNALAVSNRALAEERDRVEAARKDAESGYALARDTVERMFRDIAFGRLVNNPQTNKIRVELADEALKLYRRFAARRPDDPDLRLALGRAEGQAADRHRMVGAFDRARDGYLAAIGILKDLCERHPGRPDYLRRYAYVENQFGQLLYTKGLHAEAEPHCREAVRIAGELGGIDPADPLYASLESQTLIDVARWAALSGRHDEAERLRRRAVERARVVAARFAANAAGSLSPGDRYLLPMALSAHGASLLRLGRAAEAEAIFREVVGVHRADLGTHPGNNDTEYLLADALNDLGKTVARDPARRAEALAAEDEAVALVTRLVARFPEVAAYPRILAEFRAQRGRTRAEAGRLGEARDDLEAARGDFAERAARAKDAPEPLQQLATITGDLGRLSARQGRVEEARDLFRRAIEAQERALALQPGNPGSKDLLSRHRTDLRALDGR